jgi:NitT/TauT family transport system substrate-binding protein
MVRTGEAARAQRGWRRDAARRGVAVLCLGALGLVACGGDSSTPSTAANALSSGASASAIPDSPPTTLRLGYFPNLTHAPAIIGVENGVFQKHLDEGQDKLELKTYNAGPAAVTDILAGTLDATFIGPSPAVNAFVQSQADDPNGKVRIIAGTASGGAALVVASGINSLDDLKGKTVATPGKANTQDVALRSYLKGKGIAFDTGGADSVSIKPEDNGTILTDFAAGAVAGAWVPEPNATRMVQESAGKVLVDEKDAHPDTNGRYVTTNLLVTTDFLSKHPDVVKELLEGLSESIDFANANTAQAQQLTNQGINKLTSKPLKDAVIQAAWKNLEFTLDPVAASLQDSANAAADVGVQALPKNLPRIYDLSILNALLAQSGKPEVKGL